MKWRPSPGFAVGVVSPIVALLARTWRIEPEGAEHWRGLVAGGRPFIFLLWHEVLLPLLWHHRGQGIAIVVSEAADGRYLARYGESLGYRPVFGSSTRGGVRALLGAVRILTEGVPVAFTPDGPRGPRRELKPGVLAAAQRAGAPLLPIHAETERAWRLASWDRFMVPKPMARIRVRYGRPVTVAPGPEGLEQGRRDAVGALERLGGGGSQCPDGAAIATA